VCQGSRLQNTGLQDKKNGALGLHGCTLGLHVEKASGFGLQGKHFGATGTHWSYYGGGLTAIFGWSLLIILALQGFFFPDSSVFLSLQDHQSPPKIKTKNI